MPKGVKMRGNELRANTLSWEEHELYRIIKDQKFI